MEYGLRIQNQNAIIEKAASKKDGCYNFRGVGYRVKNGRVTHFAVNGEILERAYGFNAVVGRYPQYFNTDRGKQLKGIKG